MYRPVRQFLAVVPDFFILVSAVPVSSCISGFLTHSTHDVWSCSLVFRNVKLCCLRKQHGALTHLVEPTYYSSM
jgi:hypothetical protein